MLKVLEEGRDTSDIDNTAVLHLGVEVDVVLQVLKCRETFNVNDAAVLHVWVKVNVVL